MNRSELEHLLRAAGTVLGTDRVIVVGSQAILATVPEILLPAEAVLSVEVDLIPLEGTEALADQIDGAIGEASMFHETFGVYAQGVGYETITAPDGWKERLIAYSNDNTDGVTGLCLDINDLWLTKLAAGRPKDYEFCRSLVRAELIASDTVRTRVAGWTRESTRTNSLPESCGFSRTPTRRRSSISQPTRSLPIISLAEFFDPERSEQHNRPSESTRPTCIR